MPEGRRGMRSKPCACGAVVTMCHVPEHWPPQHLAHVRSPQHTAWAIVHAVTLQLVH
jgi:hypothetical protein